MKHFTITHPLCLLFYFRVESTNTGILLRSISHNSSQQRKKHAWHNYNSTWGLFLTGGNSHFWQGVTENEVLHLESYTPNEEVFPDWLLALPLKPCFPSMGHILPKPGSSASAAVRPGKLARHSRGKPGYCSDTRWLAIRCTERMAQSVNISH